VSFSVGRGSKPSDGFTVLTVGRGLTLMGEIARHRVLPATDGPRRQMGHRPPQFRSNEFWRAPGRRPAASLVLGQRQVKALLKFCFVLQLRFVLDKIVAQPADQLAALHAGVRSNLLRRRAPTPNAPIPEQKKPGDSGIAGARVPHGHDGTLLED